MAKKKKKTGVTRAKKPQSRNTNDILCDMESDPVILDLSFQGQPIEGLLNLEDTYDTRDNITVSWRIPNDLLEWAKEVAKREGLAKKKDIHYQKLIMGCFLEKYPIPEKE